MENKIIQYSLFKTMYDRTGNILECFYPFFLNTLEDDEYLDVLGCQTSIKNKFDLDLPIHVLQRLARISNQKGHVEISDNRNLWPLKINDIGLSLKDQLLDPKDTERKINKLTSGFVDYLKDVGIIESLEIVREYIENYIKKNIVRLSDFFFENANPDKSCFEDHEKEFTQYILMLEKKNPQDYEILKDMFYGSIISSSLLLPKNEFDGVIDSRFKKTKIYFDANYLFSLLNFHDEEMSTPANELYNLLIRFGFELRYYDFTLSEMTHVLSSFIKNYNNYPSSVKIKSLYSVLKRKKMKPSDIIDLISNLETKLAELKVYKKNTGIELETYSAEDDLMSSKLWEIKPAQGEFYHQHDLALLEKAKKLRKKRMHNFEDADNFIITSDYKLGQLCYNFFNHGSDKSISEIVLDRTFTNILFLKDPSVELSLSTIISGFSSELFVKRSVWEKFHSLLKKLCNSGEVTDDKISNLFYHGYIERELLNCEDSDIDSIDEVFVLERIEEATEIREEFIKSSLNEVKVEAEKIIESKEEEKQRELESKELEFRLNIDKKAKREANNKILFLRIFLFITLLVPLVFEGINWIQNGLFHTTILSIIRYLTSVISICFVSIPKILEKIENKIYIKRKRKLEGELFD